LGVTVVAVLQLSFAGWAKIKAKENNKKTSVTDFFNLKMFQKLFSQHFTGITFLKYMRKPTLDSNHIITPRPFTFITERTLIYTDIFGKGKITRNG